MEALTMVEILCIVTIIFLSIIGILLASILLKIRKILTPFTEVADGYQKFKSKAEIVSQIISHKIAETFSEKKSEK